MKKKCIQGNKEFDKPYTESMANWSTRHKFCSKQCKHDYQKGKLPHNKGFQKGQKPWNKDKKGKYHLGTPTLEHRMKLAISKMGDKNPAWCGGMATPQPYTTDWTMTLKRSIRERDHYTCGICKKQQEDVTFAVHHIDYNKENCNPDNLITLCSSCHSKTNHNREYWSEYLFKQSTVA